MAQGPGGGACRRGGACTTFVVGDVAGVDAMRQEMAPKPHRVEGCGDHPIAIWHLRKIRLTRRAGVF
jgi:hypothetical protein